MGYLSEIERNRHFYKGFDCLVVVLEESSISLDIGVLLEPNDLLSHLILLWDPDGSVDVHLTIVPQLVLPILRCLRSLGGVG